MAGKGGYPEQQMPPPYGAPQAPPPAYGAPPQRQVAQQVVIAAPAMRFGEIPVPMKCPFCHAQIVTGITFKAGMFTWILIGSICLIGAAFIGITWLGCCLIPCCISSCKDVEHTCPNCHRPVGTYDRLKNL